MPARTRKGADEETARYTGGDVVRASSPFMSRTQHNSKGYTRGGFGYEYWGRRAFSCISPTKRRRKFGVSVKQMTNRVERRRAKQGLRP